VVFRDAHAQRSELGKKHVARSGWLPLMLTCLALTMLFGFAEQSLIALQRGSLVALGVVAFAISAVAAIITGCTASIMRWVWRAKRTGNPQ
jgi:hypothetical protein